MDKNPLVKAGDMDSIPSPGRFHLPRSNEARAPQLLSLCCSCGSLQAKAGVPQQDKSQQGEAFTLQPTVAPTCHKEKARVQHQRPRTTRKKELFKLKKKKVTYWGSEEIGSREQGLKPKFS